jgi:hypothetical protein
VVSNAMVTKDGGGGGLDRVSFPFTNERGQSDTGSHESGNAINATTSL